jgi:hypothetical protein
MTRDMFSPDKKLYFKVLVIKAVWHKNSGRDQWTTIGNSIGP